MLALYVLRCGDSIMRGKVKHGGKEGGGKGEEILVGKDGCREGGTEGQAHFRAD